MDDVSLVFGGIQTTAIVVGIVLALMELRHMREERKIELETRQAQLFMQVYDRFSDTDFAESYVDVMYRWNWTDYDDFLKKYGPETDAQAYTRFVTMPNFFQGLGVLLKRKLIDPAMVLDLMPITITLWEKIRPFAEIRRKHLNNPLLWKSWQYLYDEVKKYEKQQALLKT